METIQVDADVISEDILKLLKRPGRKGDEARLEYLRDLRDFLNREYGSSVKNPNNEFEKFLEIYMEFVLK